MNFLDLHTVIAYCTYMAPFMQVQYNLVISISCFHRIVYKGFSLTLIAIAKSFKFKSLKS